MDLRKLLTTLRKRFWVILLGTTLVTGTTFWLSRSMTPVYQASAEILIDVGGVTQPGTEYAALLTSERSTKTYAQLATAPTVLAEVEKTWGLSPGSLAGKVSAQSVLDTQILRIVVEDVNPVLARDLANEVARVFVNQNTKMRLARFQDALQEVRAELESVDKELDDTQAKIDAIQASHPAGSIPPLDTMTYLGQLQNRQNSLSTQRTILLRSIEDFRLAATRYASNVSISSLAEVPTAPVRPRTMANTLLGAILGLAFSLGLALVMEYLDDTIKTPEDVSQKTSKDVVQTLGLPLLAAIGKFKDRRGENKLVALSDPQSPVAEAYRTLRTNLAFSAVDRPVKSILVVSPDPQVGKSLTAANLGVVLAQADRSVILVDGDLRRPSLHQLLGVDGNPGLTNLLLEETPDLEACLRETKVKNLRLLPTGPLPPNPSEVLGSEKMRNLMQRLKEKADMVILDSPPIFAVSDAVLLARLVDGTLMVLEAGVTRRGAAARAKEELSRSGKPILGVVLNKTPLRSARDYYYYYYYADGQKKKRRRKQQPSDSSQT